MMKIYFIYGVKDSGKTVLIKKLIDLIRVYGVQVGGVFSEGILENNLKISYNLNDISSDQFMKLCGMDFRSEIQVGDYFFDEAAIQFGNELIIKSIDNNKLTVIDEVGPLEIHNEGWHSSILYAIKHENIDRHLIISIRPGLIDMFVEKYEVSSYQVFSSEEDVHLLLNSILNNDL